MSGIIVAIISEGKFSPNFPARDWAYLKVGILVKTAQAGLIHFPDTELIQIERISN